MFLQNTYLVALAALSFVRSEKIPVQNSTAPMNVSAPYNTTPMNGPTPNNTSLMNETAVEATLNNLASLFRQWPESPVYHWPEEVGLEYENVTFPSEDGVPLEGWFFPCKNSNKIIIANHPRLFNRGGVPAHIEPLASLAAPSGNNHDYNLIPDYKILHDAGYNVLAFDFRNYGQSGRANGVVYTAGRYESRDVIGSLNYIRNREDTRNMIIGLFPRCMGANAAFKAIESAPGKFEGIRVILAPQPISGNMTSRVSLAQVGLSQYYDRLDEKVFFRTSLHLDQLSPIPWVKSVKIPTFIYAVRADNTTHPQDIVDIYNAIPTPEKKFMWIDSTSSRWDAYLEFQRRPEEFLKWFDTYMN